LFVETLAVPEPAIELMAVTAPERVVDHRTRNMGGT
jgi:hypothetical protein